MATKTIAPATLYDNHLHYEAGELIRQKRFADLRYPHLQQIAIYAPDEAERVAVLRERAKAATTAEADAPPVPARVQGPAPLHAGRFKEVSDTFAAYITGSDDEGEPWIDLVVKHQHEATPVWMFSGLAVTLLRAMDLKNKQRNARLDALETRLAALESRPPMLKYCGVWRSDDTYAAGDVCSDRGCMWVATEATRMRPGEAPTWTLAVKAGRDGKDLR